MKFVKNLIYVVSIGIISAIIAIALFTRFSNSKPKLDLELLNLGEKPKEEGPSNAVQNVALLDSQTGLDEENNVAVYHNVNKSIVNIISETREVTYNWFFEPVPRKGESLGTGSIFDAKGYVLTNHHVINDAINVLITLHDGTQFTGEVVGVDKENDLAVIKFAPKAYSLTPVTFGDSDALEVGQKVLAIGNPYGFKSTLTIGIVSGLGRPIQNESGLTIRDMIQTDASINPGNSGGPMLDSRGRMIGINSSIFSPSGGSVGVGFAVPINTAKRIIPDLLEYGYVRRGWIEIEPVQLFPQLVRYGKLSISKGVLISKVLPNSNAARAGLLGGDTSSAVRSGRNIIYLGGDIITHINDTKIESLDDMYGALEETVPKQRVTVTVFRKNKSKKISLILGERN